MSPFNPYTINLEINDFLLKFSNKYSYQCNFIAVNNGPDHIKKENLQKILIYYGKLRPKGQKIPGKSGDPLPIIPSTPINFDMGRKKRHETFCGGSPH